MAKLLDKKQSERNAEIVRLILKGIPMVKIGEMYGVSKQRIHQISTNFNLKPTEIKSEVKNKHTKAVFGSLIEPRVISTLRLRDI